MKHLAPTLALLLAAGFAVSCGHFGPPSEPAAAPVQEQAGSCEELAAIEDADDGDSQILPRGGRGGYVYTYVDKAGSRITPSTAGFQPTAGGPTGEGHALRFSGTLADGEEAYAGVGFGFVEPEGPYDASRFTGISFVARRAPGTVAAARVKLPDANTKESAGRCTECFNDFGIDFRLTEQWTRYVVSFADLKQEHGWGDPRPATVEAGLLYGIQFQVATPGEDFDVWIDDITFVGCDGAAIEEGQ